MVAQAEAQFAAQNGVFKRCRAPAADPRRIAPARANVASAAADLANVRRQYDRLKKLANVRLSDQTEVRAAASQEEVDNSRAALAGHGGSQASPSSKRRRSTWPCLGHGAQEEVDEAQARLRANKAQLELLKQQLADAKLRSPVDAVVRSRLMEPGEMATPQKPVFSLADHRSGSGCAAYGFRAAIWAKSKEAHEMPQIVVDSFPNRSFEGWVGFISPVAEFTPKSVQTEDLRTSLVYEVRVFVKDPENRLPLGMPATIHLPLGQQATKTSQGQP